MTVTLYLANLPRTLTELELRHFVERVCPVRSVRIARDRATRLSRGFGFVTLETPAAAERARLELDGAELGGRRVRVDDAIEGRAC